MRVAMLSYHTCPLAILGGKDTGGMNVYVRELTRQLGKEGIQVDVFTRSQDEHAPHVSHDLGYGNRVIHVNAGPAVPLKKETLKNYIPVFAEEILKFADEKHLTYDIIHSHYWMSGIAGARLKAAWRIPIVHMFHTLGKMKQRIARSEEENEGAYRIEGEKRVIDAADTIIAATPAEVAQLLWLYNVEQKKIETIPPGVNLGRFYPIPKDDAKEYIGVPTTDKLLLYVGRIEPLKGIDTLIKAIALMKDRGVIKRHNICLSIIGGDPDVTNDLMTEEMYRLKELRQKYHLNDFVTFLGRRSQTTLPYYYSAAEVVIVPSYYESFGMVALEAMACGTPVVASQVGGLVFLVKDEVTGFHVPVEDEKAMADKLTVLIEDDDLHTRMSQNAVQVAREYSWEIISKQIMRVYRTVLGK